MAARPLVSVVVPTYNQAEYLRACLDSIWFQDYPNLEIILVNDGCTDQTAEIIEAFLNDVEHEQTSFAARYDETIDQIIRTRHDRYPKEGRTIRVLDHGKNRGLAPALNTGAKASGGEFCTYVPSDNLCYPGMFSALVDALEEGYDFAFTDMLIVDDEANVLRAFTLPDYSFEATFGDWYFCGVSKLYRTELHERYGYYDEALLAHDHELFQRFAMNGARFVRVPKPLMGVRIHDGDREVNIHSSTNWNRLLEESKRLVMEARAFMAGEKG